MRVLIELENGEQFEPQDIDWIINYPDGSAKLLYQQESHDIGVIPQAHFSENDRADLAQSAGDFRNFLQKLGEHIEK